MSGKLFTQETVYESIRAQLKTWHKRGAEQNTVLAIVQNGRYGSAKVCLRDYLARLEKDNHEYYQILHQRFIEGKTANKVRRFSQDTVYRKQQEAINLIASWIIQDEQMYQTARHREKVQLQMSLMPPSQYTKLIGAEKVVAQICEHIVANAPPHITLIAGIGGIGKTAMTDAVVRRVIEKGGYDYIVWVRHEAQTMHGRSRRHSDPLAQLMGAIAKLPHIDAVSLPEMERNKRIMSALRETPHLIIFDNLEQVEDIEATLAHLPNYVQPSHFIITSRALSTIQQSGYVITLPQLDNATSVELLRHEATSNNVEKIIACTDDELAQIVRYVGGNPLALKITVGMAPYMPLEQLLIDLQKGQTSRSRKMYQHVYRVAWNGLSDDARLTLQGMMLAADSGITAAQIQAFSQIIDNGRFWDAIEQLHHRNLLEMRHGERYGIHRLTATFLRTDVLGML